MQSIWKPSKEFTREVVNFPGASFNSLYGERAVEDSMYVLFKKNFDRERPQPYLVGDDKRPVGEIWKSIEQTISSRAKEMIESTVRVKYPFGENMVYVGKPQRVLAAITKEILLPRSFNDEAKRHNESEAMKPMTSLETSFLTGQLFSDINKEELFNKKLSKILEREGMSIGDKTVIDISLHAFGKVYPDTLELMNAAAGILKGSNYSLQKMPEIYLDSPDGYGHIRADMSELKDSNQHMFIGEAKVIESLLPCGKTYAQRNKEHEDIWKKFEDEKKKGMHKTAGKKDLSKINGRMTIGTVYRTPMPKIPCGFIEGNDNCAIEWCRREGRGIAIKKGSAHFLQPDRDVK
ncbi:MAG: hypothetical protein V1678_04720 [Candidatus Aenigmatarchaeota archaeon]